MRLDPLPATRVALAVPGLLISVVAGAVLAGGEVPLPVRLLALTLLAAGPVLAVRGARAGVVRGSGAIVVRGCFRTRTVPRARVEEVTDLPALVWRRPSGRRTWTPVLALTSTSRAMRPYRLHDDDLVQRLQRYVRDR